MNIDDKKSFQSFTNHLIDDFQDYLKCTLCQGHYDFSFSDFYFIFICCVEASK